MRYLTILLTLVLVSACSNPTKLATSKPAEKIYYFQEKKDGDSIVTFIRDTDPVVVPYLMRVRVDGKPIADMYKSQSITIPLSPGQHIFDTGMIGEVQAGRTNSIAANLEKGKRYYYRIIFAGNTGQSIEPADESLFK